MVVFTGDIVPLEDTGIWPLKTDPRLEDYPEGSRARLLAEDYAWSYLNLLAHLHDALNGHPERIGLTFGAMNDLTIKANELTRLPIDDTDPRVHAGPLFLNPP